MKIQDKIAIITGASKGIGLATAKLFSQKGAKVALVARSEESLQEISKELPNSLAIPADMTKEEEIKEMVKKVYLHFKRIDILINNAGQGYDASVETIDVDKYRKIFELDVVGPVITMQEVIPFMKKEGEGAIVNISSGTALMTLPGMSPYSSMKRALVGVTLTAREELRKENIKVSVVYPYITDTDFEKNTLKESSQESNEEGGPPFPADPPEYAAEKILEAVETGKPEIFAHDWMANRKSTASE